MGKFHGGRFLGKEKEEGIKNFFPWYSGGSAIELTGHDAEGHGGKKSGVWWEDKSRQENWSGHHSRNVSHHWAFSHSLVPDPSEMQPIPTQGKAQKRLKPHNWTVNRFLACLQFSLLYGGEGGKAFLWQGLLSGVCRMTAPFELRIWRLHGTFFFLISCFFFLSFYCICGVF